MTDVSKTVVAEVSASLIGKLGNRLHVYEELSKDNQTGANPTSHTHGGCIGAMSRGTTAQEVGQRLEGSNEDLNKGFSAKNSPTNNLDGGPSSFTLECTHAVTIGTQTQLNMMDFDTGHHLSASDSVPLKVNNSLKKPCSYKEKWVVTCLRRLRDQEQKCLQDHNSLGDSMTACTTCKRPLPLNQNHEADLIEKRGSIAGLTKSLKTKPTHDIGAAPASSVGDSNSDDANVLHEGEGKNQSMMDFYTRHRLSASTTVPLKVNNSARKSCSYKGKWVVTCLRRVRDKDQAQKSLQYHNSLSDSMTENNTSKRPLLQNQSTIEKRGSVSVVTDLLNTKTIHDIGAASAYSVGDSNSDEANGFHKVVRKNRNNQVYSCRQSSEGNNARGVDVHTFKREDSGFSSEEDTSSTNGKYNVYMPHCESEVFAKYDLKDDITSPLSTITQFLSTEPIEMQLPRTPYRVVRRPSQKLSKQSSSQSLSQEDKLYLKRFEQVRLIDDTCNVSNTNDEPKLKLSIQTFASCKQLRVVVTEIEHVDELLSNKSLTRLHMEVSLKVGKTHHKIWRKIKWYDVGDLREFLHFFNIDDERMQNAELRIRFYDKERYAFKMSCLRKSCKFGLPYCTSRESDMSICMYIHFPYFFWDQYM